MKNVISWHEMLKRMEELGYVYTGDYFFIPNGHKRKQPLYRFDYHGGKETKKLTLQELKEKFDGQITVMTGTHEYAPEQSFFLITNKLYTEEPKNLEENQNELPPEHRTLMDKIIGLAADSEHFCRSLAMDAIYCYVCGNDDLWNPWADKKDLCDQGYVGTHEQHAAVAKNVKQFVLDSQQELMNHFNASDMKYVEDFFSKLCSFIEEEIRKAKKINESGGRKIMMVEFDVDWDCEADDAPESHFIAEVNFDGIDINDEEAVEEFLSDWLSEEYGYTHNGFTCEIIDKLDGVKSLMAESIRKNGEPFNYLLKESKVGRLHQYLEDPDKKFAIISANRSDASLQDNINNYIDLKKTLRENNLGYVEFIGGYKETVNDQTVEVIEPSLLIPGIELDLAIELGKKYNQESILYKDGCEMSYICTKGEHIGEVTDKFACCQGKGDFSINDAMNPYFSRFKKGSHRNKSISFILSERVYDGEIFRKSLSGGKSSPVWNDGVLIESTINRVREWMDQKECACISAYRNKLENQVPNTNTDGLEDGHIFTKKENQERSKLLKAWLLKLGYGVTAQDGIYVEETSGQKSDGKEVSFLVVNLNDDPLFFDNLFRISEYFNQDSFLYKKPGEEEAYLIGTNKAEFPGYRSQKSIGIFRPIADNGFLSKIGSKAYQFRYNENKGVFESIELAVCESTFKTQQMNSKVIIDDLYKKFPWRESNAKWRKTNNRNKMNEASLGRIYDLLNRNDVVFGIISAYRKDLLGENPNEEKLTDLNEKRYMELKNILSKNEPRYGFVELRGAYKEEGYQGKDIFEKSLLVGKIPREKLIELGKKYNQDSVIWHGDGKFELIYLNGDEPEKFSKKALSIEGKSVEELKKLTENDPKKFERMFIVGSWLARGNAVNKNRKYSFVLESRMSPSVNRGLIEQKYGSDRTWHDRLTFDIG